MNYLNWVVLALTLSIHLPSTTPSPTGIPDKSDREPIDSVPDSQTDQWSAELSGVDLVDRPSTADLLSSSLTPAEIFQQGQHSDYMHLPTELKKHIIDYAIVGNRGQLLLTNKEVAGLASDHEYKNIALALEGAQYLPEIGRLRGGAMPILRKFHSLLLEASRIAFVGHPVPSETNLVPQEFSPLLREALELVKQLDPYRQQTTEHLTKITDMWRPIFGHQLTGSLYFNTQKKLLPTAQKIDQYVTDVNGRIPHFFLLALYHYAKTNRDDPLFQPNTWDFINPDHLSAKALVDQFPLLALVDAQPDGHHILQVLYTLTEPKLRPFIARGWELKDLERMRRLLRFDFRQPVGQVDMTQIFAAMLPPVISLVMARLATHRLFDHLMQFMDGLAVLTDTLATDQMNGNTFYHYFNRLAIVMAAVGQHQPALEQFTQVYTNESSGIPPAEIPVAQAELVQIMRSCNHSKGAEFLRKYWGLPVDAVSTSTTGAAREEPPAKIPPPMVKYNKMFTQRMYYLTSTNQMVVALVRAGNPSAEVAKLPHKALPTLVKGWEQFAHQMTPEKFNRLRRLAFASTHLAEGMQVDVSVSELLKDTTPILHDF
ncbi:hypothetical protein H4R33_003158 [Dimargaris cristalligena]|nr:hypothetical protein H4R33_003158 [Dimargaris cristalligena]